MKIYYNDGGALRCSKIVWCGSYFMADDFYIVYPEDIESIEEG